MIFCGYTKTFKRFFLEFAFCFRKSKEDIFYNLKKISRNESGKINNCHKEKIAEAYRKQILSIPSGIDNNFYKEIAADTYKRKNEDAKIIAYYLPQMHPTPENDAWWGKGVTEWTNVSKAVPQYLGHYQPRLPGELGYYDLRLKENIIRQTELAKTYGVFAFCWYYYWFDGRRLLNQPLDLFLNSKNIDFPFCLCWANEDWTKSFSGSSKEILIKQSETEESYKEFIKDAVKYLSDDRYVRVNNKKLLIIYKPQDIPNCKKVLAYWREFCINNGIGDLYIIGCWTSDHDNTVVEDGFDASAEFQPGSILKYCEKINKNISFVNDEYFGAIYSYKNLVENEIYNRNNYEKMYNAVMPMWDNTPRRNNKGSVIFDGSTPCLYKKWLKKIIISNKRRKDLDDNLIFVNAWNEWGEGTYLEPDRMYGYAYLQATRDAIEECKHGQ